MDYQKRKIRFIEGDKIEHKTRKMNLKRINALINSIRQCSEKLVSKISVEIQELSLENFLEDLSSSILHSGNQNIFLKMQIFFEISGQYENFQDIFLNQLRETIRNNINSEHLVFLSEIYTEVCSCDFNKFEKFKNYLRKTFGGIMFGKRTLQVMYELIIFFNAQRKITSSLQFELKEKNSQLIDFYQNNLEILKQMYIKIENKVHDYKYHNLINSFFSLKKESNKFHQVIKLSAEEKKFYQVVDLQSLTENPKPQKLTTNEIIKKIRNTQFILQNMSRAQKNEHFIISLLSETTEIKYLAKLAVCLNLDISHDLKRHLEPILKQNQQQKHEFPIGVSQYERSFYLLCELYKFHHFDRQTLMFILSFLFRTKKLIILIKCLDRVGRFLLDQTYSPEGNQDIIQLLINLENRANEVNECDRKIIKNFIKRLFFSENDQKYEVEHFLERSFKHSDHIDQFMQNFNDLLKNNRLFLAKLIFALCTVTEPISLAKIMNHFNFDCFFIEQMILICFKIKEKHRGLIFAQSYSVILNNAIKQNNENISNLETFIKKVLFHTQGHSEYRLDIALNILEYCEKEIVQSIVGNIFDFVELNQNQRILTRLVDFCRVRNL